MGYIPTLQKTNKNNEIGLEKTKRNATTNKRCWLKNEKIYTQYKTLYIGI